MPTAAQAERRPTLESVGESLREARHAMDTARRAAGDAVNTARHSAEEAMNEATLKIRRHPLRSVAGVLVIGVVAGALAGLGAGWFAARRC